MNTSQQAIRTYFAKLGLEHEVADIYLALHTHGPQNISALSRNAKVERTRIYRLIDRLMESNLIELESAGRRGVIKAAPIANLRILINQREEELRNLHDELGLIEQTLARNSLSNPAVHVQSFHGAEGLRQMLNNRLEAQAELLCYGEAGLEAFVGKDFMAGWITTFNARTLSGRLLCTTKAGINDDCFEIRTIEPDTFRIMSASDIYDDTVASYHWHDGEPYGIIIRNKAFAENQRQLFETIWTSAKN